ncbi:Endocuticle structural glycoprotein SgAbd-5 [Eumeta japonica]|uniref:Endocuticle structural glycoprotein SgAbd-5 n=1 Tax=Eumeta variegata TaxID=151549 RepID=A0A4C1YCE4_EUMVA|nr:Endocuticle structural glycoprotein SgAbd-5 [Eumeta japonica]
MYSLGTLVLALAVLAVTFADDAKPPPAQILSDKSNVNANGYNFEFNTSDGVSRQEEGELISVGEHKGIGIKGSYSYTGPDGQQYQVTFTADDKGYRPELRVIAPGSQPQQ